MRKYSIYSRKRSSRYWVRRSGVALPKASAVRFFHDVLISGAFDPEQEWRLRPVPKNEG